MKAVQPRRILDDIKQQVLRWPKPEASVHQQPDPNYRRVFQYWAKVGETVDQQTIRELIIAQRDAHLEQGNANIGRAAERRAFVVRGQPDLFYRLSDLAVDICALTTLLIIDVIRDPVVVVEQC